MPRRKAARTSPYTVEYYYKVQWGHQQEFLDLFLKNHYPLLQKIAATGRVLLVKIETPAYHTTEDGRWDYRVTIRYKNSTLATTANPEEEAFIQQLWPDQPTYKKEEQRRFEILLLSLGLARNRHNSEEISKLFRASRAFVFLNCPAPLVRGGMQISEIDGQSAKQFIELGSAFVLSAAIGLERQIRNKSAGMRTYTVVGMAAALFVLVSKYGFTDVLSNGRIVLDPSRVAAQIVSGIGFIGAGLIFVEGDRVKGLTTAATIWLVTGIGMACGAGLPWLALASTGAYFIVALIFPFIVRLLPVVPTPEKPRGPRTRFRAALELMRCLICRRACLVVSMPPLMDQVFCASGHSGNSNWKPASSRRPGTTRRLFSISFHSVFIK